MDSILKKSLKKRRVLIGVVAFDGILPEAQRSFLQAFYNLGKRYAEEFEFPFEIVRKREQFRAKNYLTDMAIKFDCEYMWQVDDDTVLNGNTFDTLVKMLDEDEDAGIAGCIYSHKGKDQHPVVMWTEMTPLGNAVSDYYHPHELTGDVMEVGAMGGGCMMFRVSAFKEMMEPYFWNEADVGTDIQICMRFKEAGWKVICHTGHEVGHVGDRHIWYPSLVDKPMADIRRFNERLYFDLLEYHGINGDEYRTIVLRSMLDFQNKWTEKKPETPLEIMKIYEEEDMQEHITARNVFYNMKHRKNWSQFTEYVEMNGVKKALDFGCGIGYASQILAQHGVDVTAIDLDVDVVHFLEWRAKRHKFADRLNVIKMKDNPDGRDYIPDELFDVIVVKDVLEHLTNPEEILSDLLLHLAPGGMLFSNAHVVEFKRAEHGVPQHLDLLPPSKFIEICLEHGVKAWYGCLLRKEA